MTKQCALSSLKDTQCTCELGFLKISVKLQVRFVPKSFIYSQGASPQRTGLLGSIDAVFEQNRQEDERRVN